MIDIVLLAPHFRLLLELVERYEADYDGLSADERCGGGSAHGDSGEP